MKKIVSLEEAKDEDRVGGKAASLSTACDVTRVPQGFVITNEAFRDFLESRGLADKVLSVLARTDIEDRRDLRDASRKIKNLFDDSRLSDDLKDSIEDAYKNFVISSEAKKAGRKAMELIKAGREKPPVVVRSSPHRADGVSPGVYRNSLNVRGDDNLVEEVKKVWESFYSPEAIYYRERMGYPHDAPFGVLVQKMIEPDKSLAFIERDPCNAENSVIEGVHGMGEIMSRGEVRPDFYFFSSDGALQRKEVNDREWVQDRNPSTGDLEKQPLSSSKKGKPLLDRSEARELYSRVSKVASRFGATSIVEFCTRNDDIFVLDVVPADNYGKYREGSEERGETLLEGTGLSPGETSGTVARSGRNSEGKVLVKDMPSIDDMLFGTPSAILTKSGGFSSNYAKLSRELEMPCITSRDSGGDELRVDEEIRLDACAGKVLRDAGTADNYGEGHSLEADSGRGLLSQDVDSITATELMVFTDSKNFDPNRAKEAEGFVVLVKEPEDMGVSFGIRSGRNLVDKIKECAGMKEVWLQADSSQKGINRVSDIVEELGRGSNTIRILMPSSGFSEVDSLSRTLGLGEKDEKGLVVDTPELLLSSERIGGSDIDLFHLDFERLVQLFFGHEDRGNIMGSETFWDSVDNFCDICSEAGSQVSVSGASDKRYLKKLIESGVDRVVVRPENFNQVKNTVARVEKKLLLERMR